jgi:translocon-associated protein (TRAP) beta subunit
MRPVRPKASNSNRASGVRVAILIVSGVLMLAGCGSSESDGAKAGGKDPGKTSAGVPKTARPDMVAAVSSSKAPGNVELRFNIPERPLVGQRTEIQLSLVPTVELERLVARFQVPEGLELVSGAETPRIDRPPPGNEISHTLVVIPKADGIFNITAVVLTDTPTDSVSRAFSIPLIAGAGFPEAPPPTSPPPPSRPN